VCWQCLCGGGAVPRPVERSSTDRGPAGRLDGAEPRPHTSPACHTNSSRRTAALRAAWTGQSPVPTQAAPPTQAVPIEELAMFTNHIMPRRPVIFLRGGIRTRSAAMNMHKYAYWRTLPHIQKNNRPLFVTFSTFQRWILPTQARQAVLDCCLQENGGAVNLHAAVVMPDHVHLIFTPLLDTENWTCSLPDIMRRIKGRSAHHVNRLLGRRGRVWQDESFDHVLRSSESLAEKIEYVCQNPVRAGLVQSADCYPWLWVGALPWL